MLVCVSGQAKLEAEEAAAAQAIADALEAREYADASIQFKTQLQTVAAGGALLVVVVVVNSCSQVFNIWHI